jgi:hypothetical protein
MEQETQKVRNPEYLYQGYAEVPSAVVQDLRSGLMIA